jgi:hypothetical protein
LEKVSLLEKILPHLPDSEKFRESSPPAPFLFAGWLKAFALGDLEQCFRLGRALF